MVLDEIKSQLKEAMKNGDKKTVLATRNILEKIKKEQVDSKEEINENTIMKIIAKHAKQLRESIVQFEKGNRLDLAEKEKEELLIAEKFLPEQLNEEDIKIIVLESIQELNANQMADMGKVMKNVLDKTKGMADGKIVSNLVRENLS
tara:strand:+ start:669 stop:1109 length:441 start_codon:yes stop_codon:yes gene_type:complete